MPRANRYIVPGYIYHLTHRCHDRAFLLKFAKDRHGYRRRLREAVVEHDLSLLSYNITCNHIHLIAFADTTEQIALVMQRAAGEFARDYNRRKARSGAFWEGRYHATMVDSGQYLWNCLKYVELNMVRCGEVQHPGEWEWSGYREMMGKRKRHRLLDFPKLLELAGAATGVEEFRRHFNRSLEESILKDELQYQEKWTQALAVGSQSFVKQMEPQIRQRQGMEYVREGETWVLKEEYAPLFSLEK